jgi:hypothetical protein
MDRHVFPGKSTLRSFRHKKNRTRAAGKMRQSLAKGRFRVTLLAGCQYSFSGEGGGFRFVTLAKQISIEPGETKDLGTLTFDKDGKLLGSDAK